MTTHEDEHQRVADRISPNRLAVRRGAFYVAVVAALVLYGVMMGEMLTFVFVGWFTEPGAHHFHELVMFALIWLGIVGLATQLYRPDERVNAVLAPVLVMTPLAVIAVSSDSPIAMMPIVFGVVGLIVAALHPAGRSLVAVGRDVPGRRTLGALLAVAAVPLFVYAGDQIVLQYSAADDHAAFVHYGGMATVAGFVLVMGVLGAVRDRDRRFAAWSAGLLAAYLGLAAAVYPDQASSTGILWGTLAILWAGAFIVSFERTPRRES